jgi:hypothetical protein
MEVVCGLQKMRVVMDDTEWKELCGVPCVLQASTLPRSKAGTPKE